MKKVSVFLSFCLITSMAFGQNFVNDNFQHLKEKEEFTSIHMSSKMFELASYIEIEKEDEDFKNFKDIITSLYSFDMIVGDEVDSPSNHFTSAMSKIGGNHEELMSVDDKDGKFSFFIDENNGIVKELVMIGMGSRQFMVLSLQGEMDLKKLGSLAQKMQGEGFDNLSKVFDHGADQVSIYPNPATGSESVTLTVPEDMEGGVAKVFDLQGKEMMNVSLNSGNQELNIGTLGAGQYFVHLIKDNVVIKKKLIVQ